MDLFNCQIIPVPLTAERQSHISFWPNWLPRERADALLERSIAEIPWRKDSIRIVGKTIPIPRLQQWFGDPKTSYTYSNIRLQAVTFPEWMDTLRESVERETEERFNRALDQRVRLFQRTNGLDDDGVVGERTLLKLNEQLFVDVTAAQARQRLQAQSMDVVQQ